VLIELRQHAISAVGMGRWPLLPQLELDLGVDAGATLYERRSSSRDMAWQTTGDYTSFSAELGALAELRWAFTHRLGVSILCGIDLLLRPVGFAYSDSLSQREILSQLSRLEPWVALSLSADLLSF
jgi:hypothetical protein